MSGQVRSDQVWRAGCGADGCLAEPTGGVQCSKARLAELSLNATKWRIDHEYDFRQDGRATMASIWMSKQVKVSSGQNDVAVQKDVRRKTLKGSDRASEHRMGFETVADASCWSFSRQGLAPYHLLEIRFLSSPIAKPHSLCGAKLLLLRRDGWPSTPQIGW